MSLKTWWTLLRSDRLRKASLNIDNDWYDYLINHNGVYYMTNNNTMLQLYVARLETQC